MSSPRVSINGFDLPSTWTPDGSLVATETITIPWGRSKITDEVAGHAATVVLLDISPDGAASSQLVGQRLAVDRVTALGIRTRILSGAVAEVTAKSLRLRNPNTRAMTEVQRLEVTVSDQVAVLATLLRGGLYYGLPLWPSGTFSRYVQGPWGHRGWDSQFAADRLADLVSQSDDWIRAASTPRATLPAPTHPRAKSTSQPIRPVGEGVPSSALVPLWPLLVGVYAGAEGLGWPRVIPDVRVEQGRPQTPAAIRLVTGTLSTHRLRVVSTDTTVPAVVLGLDSAEVLPAAGTTQRTKSVTVSISAHEYEWQGQLIDASTGRELRKEQMLDADTSESVTIDVPSLGAGGVDITLPSRSASTIVLPRSAPTNPAATSRDAAPAAWNAAIAVALEAATRAGKLNGWRQLPPLTVRPKAEADEIPALLNTWDTDAIYIAGSKWSGLDGVPYTIQIIGGTLEWTHRGWKHTLTAAATLDTRRHNLPIAVLLGALPNRFDYADPALTWADLIAATERSVA